MSTSVSDSGLEDVLLFSGINGNYYVQDQQLILENVPVIPSRKKNPQPFRPLLPHTPIELLRFHCETQCLFPTVLFFPFEFHLWACFTSTLVVSIYYYLRAQAWTKLQKDHFEFTLFVWHFLRAEFFTLSIQLTACSILLVICPSRIFLTCKIMQFETLRFALISQICKFV